MPPHIAQVLYVVAVLAEYGQHLIATLERRAAARTFATVARYFGTATVSVILAHLYRGVMRAVALDRMLRRRAARGRDLKVLPPRGCGLEEAKPAAPSPAAASGLLPAEAPPAPTTPPEAAAAQAAASRPARVTGPQEPLTLANLPTMAQMDAEVQRCVVGTSVVAICRDLGVSPTLCEGSFWNRVFDVIRCFRGSFGNIVLEMGRREKKFDRDVQDKNRNLDWPDETTAGIRRALGFLIGEIPLDPFSVVSSPGAAVAAAATGPP